MPQIVCCKFIKKSKTKIWRIRIRIFWRFWCCEQVNYVKSLVKISSNFVAFLNRKHGLYPLIYWYWDLRGHEPMTHSLKLLHYMQGSKKSLMQITLSLVLRIFVTSKSSLTDSVSSSFSADLLTSKTSMLSKRSWKKRRKISKLRIEKILEKTKKKHLKSM